MKKILLLIPFFLYANVKNEIIKFYKSHYPTIQIITIKSNKPFPKHYKKISFKLANYKMPSSTLIIDNKYYFYKIKAKIAVFIADKIIYVNEPIKPNATQKLINFRNFYAPPITKIDDNLIASKIISKNSVITKNDVRIKPLILKGEEVSVIFEDKNIEIYSKGKALNDANCGDIVKVKIKSNIYSGIADKNANVIIK